MNLMNDLYKGATGHDDIVSVRTGWSDEHIHTELMTTEGMDRVWSFQRSLIHGMVTARETVKWSPTEPDTEAKAASK